MKKLGFCMVLVALAHCQQQHGGEIQEKDEVLQEEKDFTLPDFPGSLAKAHPTSQFNSIWENRLFQSNLTGILRRDDPKRPEPATIVAPTEIQMHSMIPQDAPNPLYHIKYPELTDDFLQEHMSVQPISMEDPLLLTPEGLTIKNMRGQDITFKKDPKANTTTANGIIVADVHKIDGIPPLTVLDLDGVLFDIRSRVQKAYEELSGESKILNPPLPGLSGGGHDANRK